MINFFKSARCSKSRFTLVGVVTLHFHLYFHEFVLQEDYRNNTHKYHMYSQNKHEALLRQKGILITRRLELVVRQDTGHM